MSELVSGSEIEGIVGAKRHPLLHLGRLVWAERRLYVLHPEKCLGRFPDLRACPHSRMLDRGLARRYWRDRRDEPVALRVVGGRLAPVVSGAGMLRIVAEQVAAFQDARCKAPGVGVQHPGTHRVFEHGGWLEQGVTFVDNRSGVPEKVMTDTEWRQQGE